MQQDNAQGLTTYIYLREWELIIQRFEYAKQTESEVFPVNVEDLKTLKRATDGVAPVLRELKLPGNAELMQLFKLTQQLLLELLDFQAYSVGRLSSPLAKKLRRRLESLSVVHKHAAVEASRFLAPIGVSEMNTAILRDMDRMRSILENPQASHEELQELVHLSELVKNSIRRRQTAET